MSFLLQVALALGAWFLAMLTTVARLGYEDRRVPEGKQRGVSILPVWPLMPLLALTPALLVGSQNLIMKIIAGFHGLLLLWSLGRITYWTIRRHRDV